MSDRVIAAPGTADRQHAVALALAADGTMDRQAETGAAIRSMAGLLAALAGKDRLAPGRSS